MQVFAILKTLVAARKLAKKYWPVLGVILAIIAKVSSGDTSGISELFAALVAAIAAVNGANKADKAEEAIGKARASGIADVIAVAVRSGKEDSTAATIGELEGGEHVKLVPVNIPAFIESAPPFRFADVAPYMGVQTPEAK